MEIAARNERKQYEMKLTESNYHSLEATQLWLSASSIKRAHRCESEWFNGEQNEDKPAFIAGHLFELLVTCDEQGLEQLKLEHPEMYSSRGETKGALKAEYAKILECSEAVLNQPFLAEIIQNAKKQVILTGIIDGLPIRMMCDLMTPNGDIYDLKTAKNFSREWSENADGYVEWWQYWDYPMQLWIYREIARQNGITTKHVGLIGVSKSNCDIQALEFSEDTLAQAKADVLYTIGRIKAVRNGSKPLSCGYCSHCIKTKQIKRFEVI